MQGLLGKRGVDWMSTAIIFEEGEKVRLVCECGTMEGKVEQMQWGKRIHFRCGDCQTFVAMEVTE